MCQFPVIKPLFERSFSDLRSDKFNGFLILRSENNKGNCLSFQHLVLEKD